MKRRPRHLLAMLLLSLAAPVGCLNWEYRSPQSGNPARRRGSGSDAIVACPSAQEAQRCWNEAEALESKGFIAEAIRELEKARRYDPQIPGVARRLALLQDRQGNAALAEGEYLRALREQPRDAELLNDFGDFHYRHYRIEVAENWLRNAVAVDPRYAPAWINLGRVLAYQGRAEESRQAFAHAVRPTKAPPPVEVASVEKRPNRLLSVSYASISYPPAYEPGIPQTPPSPPPSSIPLSPTPPQATLTDCRADTEPRTEPQSP